MTDGLQAAARQVYDERLAPWVRDLDIRIERIGSDGVRLRMPASGTVQHTQGIVCGHALMALADVTMLFLIMGTYGRYTRMLTLNQSTSFYRSATNVDVIAEGRVRKRGQSVIFGEALLYADGDKEPVAQSTATCSVHPDDR